MTEQPMLQRISRVLCEPESSHPKIAHPLRIAKQVRSILTRAIEAQRDRAEKFAAFEAALAEVGRIRNEVYRMAHQ